VKLRNLIDETIANLEAALDAFARELHPGHNLEVKASAKGSVCTITLSETCGQTQETLREGKLHFWPSGSEPSGQLAHLFVISSPELWPRWPYLPIKRHTKDDIETAVLHHTKQGSLQIQHRNIFLMNTQAPATEANAENLTQSGWEVD